MEYKTRVPEELFQPDGHYLGRPADFNDRIITRRVRLVEGIKNFVGKKYNLLDIGCGNGASMFLLADKMNKCDGLEVTDEHLDLFSAYKSKNQIHNCTYSITDVTTSEPTEQYDRIISFEVIEHLSDEEGVSYYYKALKEDGLLAITVPNKWWIFETHGAKLPLLPWNRVPLFSWLPRFIHERFANARIYTKRRIHKLLEHHGFEIMESKYVTAPMDVLPEGRFKAWIINSVFNSDVTNIPFKATSIFVVAKKRKIQ